MYLKIIPDKYLPINNSFFEVGLVRRPWLDFEQSINQYRMQGTMFAEHFGIINSADFGITYIGLPGKKVDFPDNKGIQSKYPGRYGSFALGVYNGGGYSSLEYNNNKTFETRLSLRPFPDFAPGFIISHNYAIGKANTPDNSTDFNMNLICASWESKPFTAAMQYYSGTGDYKGMWKDAQGASYDNWGWSVFSELHIPQTAFALFGRYDNFTSKQEIPQTLNNLVAGISYRFMKSKVTLYYRTDLAQPLTQQLVETVLEIKF